MRKIRTVSHKVDTMFTLILFGVFAVSVLLVLLAGAGAYQDIAARMERQYEERTCLSYLDAKVRHYDAAGQVVVEMLDECQALALYEEIEGVRYKTLIYCYDGYVRELFFEDGLQFHPADGQPVIAAQNLDVELAAGNLLRLTCVTKAGVQEEVLLYLRSGKGADAYA